MVYDPLPHLESSPTPTRRLPARSPSATSRLRLAHWHVWFPRQALLRPTTHDRRLDLGLGRVLDPRVPRQPQLCSGASRQEPRASPSRRGIYRESRAQTPPPSTSRRPNDQAEPVPWRPVGRQYPTGPRVTPACPFRPLSLLRAPRNGPTVHESTALHPGANMYRRANASEPRADFDDRNALYAM